MHINGLIKIFLKTLFTVTAEIFGDFYRLHVWKFLFYEWINFVIWLVENALEKQIGAKLSCFRPEYQAIPVFRFFQILTHAKKEKNYRIAAKDNEQTGTKEDIKERVSSQASVWNALIFCSRLFWR